MASYETTMTLPVPLASVVPAAAVAARAVDNGIRLQTPQTLICQGSWLRLVGNRATIRVDVWGQDGAAVVKVVTSMFGWGPIATTLCRADTDTFCRHLVQTLQRWSAQAAAGAPTQRSR
jgi:hypothetical protein